ncbi:MAG TPA: hypothetical protein VFN38_16245 [Gemmatimonadaceae bacterium]|nr:hypothetical protein [Gemmatimonadaceae bacterium]
MPRFFWLMKCEPAAYAIGDLARVLPATKAEYDIVVRLGREARSVP